MEIKQAFEVLVQSLEKANQNGAFSLTKETPVVMQALAKLSEFVQQNMPKEETGKEAPKKSLKKAE